MRLLTAGSMELLYGVVNYNSSHCAWEAATTGYIANYM